jgi:hypothetical protein
VLLLPDALLAERRQITREGELGALYESLSAELEPLVRVDVFIPESKALLSRQGGRCEKDATPLEFDPWSPHDHRCPRCGSIFRGELHDRAWVMPYQLWLAERAVHAALFFALRGDARHGALALRILGGYADRYLKYPNVDNVLGPTRLFFSTYLESIWLLQICVATDLLRAAGNKTIAGEVADRIVEPSRRLIGEFDEGMSNRQVWNNAALVAAAALLGDSKAFDERVHSRQSAVTAHLSNALLEDATWYEGENYHQFALRGLWYGVTMAESRGAAIPELLRDRFDRAFDILYLTALPDFTMPSRKDSQYAVSLRQWRIAELAELGFARRGSSVLASALARTYEDGHDRVETGRARSTADAERNGDGGSLTRADLGWRALLHAVPRLHAIEVRQPQSTLLEAQGLSVFRRSPDVYVSFDYGTYGGGHGHPDRLNVTLIKGRSRILDDLGTGSYVDPSLHWYRSSLAHNAPLVDGRSQPERDGRLVAHDERGALGWTVAEVEWKELGVRLERAIIAAPGYFVDELRWTAERDVNIDLPWHLNGDAALSFQPAALRGASGLEDGFEFVRETAVAALQAGVPVEITAPEAQPAFKAWLTAASDAQLFRGLAPAQPSTREERLYVLRAHGKRGTFRAVIAWAGVTAARFRDNGVDVELDDQTRHAHTRDEKGWHVELFALGARSSVDLSGFRDPTPPTAPTATPVPPATTLSAKPLLLDLAEQHYRRSEQNWIEAGSPHATVRMSASDDTLSLVIDVNAGDKRFMSADAVNELDNEHVDTMGAGIELFLVVGGKRAAWMLVPDAAGRVRARPIVGWTELSVRPSASWQHAAEGYEMMVGVPLANAHELRLDILINETTHDRQRRRGQLVLSGAEGEFVYLRGDRHDEDRLITFRLTP